MPLVKQVISFALIGVINTIVDVGSYALLISAGVPLVAAILISSSLGLVSSYTLNHRITFKASGHTARTVVRFLAVSLVGLWVLQPVIIVSITTLFSLHSVFWLTVAKLVGTGFTMIWNFCWYRLRVFI